jgi:hypothetical protein
VNSSAAGATGMSRSSVLQMPMTVTNVRLDIELAPRSVRTGKFTQ